MKIVVGEGKSAKLWAPHALHFSGSHPSVPTHSIRMAESGLAKASLHLLVRRLLIANIVCTLPVSPPTNKWKGRRRTSTRMQC